MLENTFGDITYMINMNTLGVRDNIYSTCYGMIKYYCEKLALRGINYSMYEKVLENEKDNNIAYENVLEKIQTYMES